MMKKLFDRYIDKPDSGFAELAQAMQKTPQELLPVRLVSHHLRLLGLLAQEENEDHLAVVDCDRSQKGK